MYRLILATALLVSTEASAFDQFRKSIDHSRPYEEAKPVQDWSGIKMGIHVGIANTTGEASIAQADGVLLPLDISNGLFHPTTKDDVSYASISGSIGYDVQLGSFITGFEVDATFTDLRSNHGTSVVDPNTTAPFTGIDTNSGYLTSLSSVATARARLGYDLGNTMVYATAGVAAGEVTNRFSLSLPDLGYRSPYWGRRSYKTGYVLGAGLEHKINETMAIRAEYQHIDLQDARVLAVDPVSFPGESITYKFRNKFDIAKVGLVVKY